MSGERQSQQQQQKRWEMNSTFLKNWLDKTIQVSGQKVPLGAGRIFFPGPLCFCAKQKLRDFFPGRFDFFFFFSQIKKTKNRRLTLFEPKKQKWGLTETSLFKQRGQDTLHSHGSFPELDSCPKRSRPFRSWRPEFSPKTDRAPQEGQSTHWLHPQPSFRAPEPRETLPSQSVQWTLKSWKSCAPLRPGTQCLTGAISCDFPRTLDTTK